MARTRFIWKNPTQLEGLDYHCSFLDVNEGKAHIRKLHEAGIAAHYGLVGGHIHIYTEG